MSEELEEKGDDESDGGDVSDEDEAADIDPRDIKVAQEKGWLYMYMLKHTHTHTIYRDAIMLQ